MLERYVEKNGKKLRCGYTTGSCAAAATKAACQHIVGQQVETEALTLPYQGVVALMTPKGWLIDIPYTLERLEVDFAICSVEKDAGDDIDATRGMKIISAVQCQTGAPYALTNGVGVGTVTKPGLSVDVGQPAINPVPQKMIREAVEEILETTEGVAVEISAPEGIEIAKRTFNPKLGVVGGISIIGTSGIVEPMSEEALIDTMRVELSVLAKSGVDTVLLSPGNYGRDFSISMGLRVDEMVKTSNFIGAMLDEAEKLGIKRLLWVGHIGKMIKVAGGIFHTHSKIADGRMEIMAAYLGVMGAPQALLEAVLKSTTTDDAISKIEDSGYMGVFDLLASRVSARSEERVFGNVEVGTILFSNLHGLLGMDDKGRQLMEVFKHV
ncbi:MAG: cobalamin biosynthesis protein CbiD [Clostridia bacterium]|nr:cobalamin biosynthesis protein CbiD [Clostridia bacterium]